MKETVINAYLCAAGHRTITRDVNHGTTPFTITCRYCVADERYGVIAHSVGYNVDQSLEPSHEWYAPAHPERIKDTPTRQHCQSGGLLLRVVGEGDFTLDLPDIPKGANRPISFSQLVHRSLTNNKR